MKKIIMKALLCASVLQASDDIQLHIQNHKKIIHDNPADMNAQFAYGSYLAHLDDTAYYTEALCHLETAAYTQYNTQWLFELGTFACRIGEFQKSLKAYQTILEKHPTLTSVVYNSAYTLKTAGEFDIAIRLYEKIIAKDPSYQPARLGLAFAYLQKGDYVTGWKLHHWNLKEQHKFSESLYYAIQHNQLQDTTVLLTPEGGIGDILNFIRYAQRIKAMGAHVVVAVPECLFNLLSRCSYIDQLITLKSPLPHYDFKTTLMSLPAHFEDTERTIPHNIPYIFPDPSLVTQWQKRLSTDNTIKIGICWQPDIHNDVSRLPIARRGIPLALLSTIGSLPGISLYSLQKKEGLDQLKEIPSSITIHTFDDFDESHGSFMDSASIIQCLDIMITTDTAIAHLAGGMGKKVWLLLPYSTDWRWLQNRSDSPWYPTMKIFKQHAPFDWSNVIQEITTTLQKEYLIN